MIQDKFGEKIAPDDPERCQSGGKTGQCPYKRLSGTQYCARHGGVHNQKVAEESTKNAYRLAKWQNRVNEFAEHEQVKSLRGEIGITRMLLEEILLKCSDSNELLMFSGKIADLVTRVEKLVTSCQRIEASTGMLLDKTAAIHLASVIVEIISRYVSDEDAIESISNEIVLSILSHKTEVEAK